jgi:hypothetical protein
MKTQTIVPVILSILVIILVAILERHSRWVAAITATMPLGAPLALWIVFASVGGETQAVSEFSLNMLMGILPTLGFLLVAWIVARAGWGLGSILMSGYAAWGVGLLILVTVKRLIGIT